MRIIIINDAIMCVLFNENVVRHLKSIYWLFDLNMELEFYEYLFNMRFENCDVFHNQSLAEPPQDQNIHT